MLPQSQNKNNNSLSPQGFLSYVTNVGIKNATDDLSVVFSTHQCNAAGIYTQNIFPGAAISISRNNIINNEAQALIVISKNANVATGTQGHNNAQQIVSLVSKQLEIAENLVQIGATGVIGRLLPMSKIKNGLHKLADKLQPADFLAVAKGICTTDRYAKIYSCKIGNSVLTGIAKGVGMIEPDMATLLVYFFTDAAIEKNDLDKIFKSVMARTFNCISVDTDTSTSDSAVIFANGLAGAVDLNAFEQNLYDISLQLILDILKDGEGASKIIEVNVIRAQTYTQAKAIGKSIINSPLVKTAVAGADPNWGRIIMAIGKCPAAKNLDNTKISIKIGDIAVYPQQLSTVQLLQLKDLMHQDAILIEVNLNTATTQARVWGCDLTCKYVKFNSDYTS